MIEKFLSHRSFLIWLRGEDRRSIVPEEKLHFQRRLLSIDEGSGKVTPQHLFCAPRKIDLAAENSILQLFSMTFNMLLCAFNWGRNKSEFAFFRCPVQHLSSSTSQARHDALSFNRKSSDTFLHFHYQKSRATSNYFIFKVSVDFCERIKTVLWIHQYKRQRCVLMAREFSTRHERNFKCPDNLAAGGAEFGTSSDVWKLLIATLTDEAKQDDLTRCCLSLDFICWSEKWFDLKLEYLK